MKCSRPPLAWPLVWACVWAFVWACVMASGVARAQLSVTAVPADSGGLSLDQAIARASANQPAVAVADAERRALALERSNAKAALLPSAIYHNQAIYTQSNGVPASRVGQVTTAPAPIFIANNAVREYASQGLFNETIGLAQVGAIRLANATSLRADAEYEIARRGLVATVVGLYYGVGANGEKVVVGERALTEANRFVEITQKRESAREVAHADVLKAQLSQQQRQRELQETRLASDKARLELGVLINPDPTTPYTLETAGAPPLLPDQAGINAVARQNNPELRGALASLQVSQAQTYTANAALTPQLVLNFTYGIDATNFASTGPDGIHNVGYAMGAGLDIPLWDWLISERKIKEAHLRQNASKAVLSAAQRRLVANLAEYYAEADAAYRQMTLLDTTVVTARESLRLVNMRYVDGESTVLDVVDAQNTLITAETSRIDGRVRYQLALASLQTLTGKL